MFRNLILAAVFGLIVLPGTVSAQDSSAKQPGPGIWYDITKTPYAEGTYGAGLTSTRRVLERCTALLQSIKMRDGEVRGYARDYQTGYCLGFANSAMAFFNIRDNEGGHVLGVCLPEAIDSQDVVEALLTYAHKNQEHAIYNPTLLTYWALLEKYPCKK
jgi:Ssp1 endopeptidase immunity protein Rap1a